VTPEPSRPRIRGLLGVAPIAALIVAGAVLALLLSRGGGGSSTTEAGPGAGVLPTAPASAPPTTSRSTTSSRPRTAPPGTWPAGLSGFTVVLATVAKRDHPRAAAERLARSVRLPGLRARVLDSSLHPRLRPSVWIVYVGRYRTRNPAERVARRLHAAGIRGGVVERLTG
jgi:hypothetical protein